MVTFSVSTGILKILWNGAYRSILLIWCSVIESPVLRPEKCLLFSVVIDGSSHLSLLSPLKPGLEQRFWNGLVSELLYNLQYYWALLQVINFVRIYNFHNEWSHWSENSVKVLLRSKTEKFKKDVLTYVKLI